MIILFALLGLIFIFLEFFLVGALFAILGSLFIILSLVLFFLSFPLVWLLGYLALIVFAVIGICKGALWWIKSSKRRGEFYLQDDQEGYSASFFDRSLVGKEGVAVTELKTAGHVLIEQKRYQALSEGGFITKDASIVVIGGRGAYLIVKELIHGQF
ncbi:MAG: NfeD family protein [Candidatus Rhabdochlamydia sp.]